VVLSVAELSPTTVEIAALFLHARKIVHVSNSNRKLAHTGSSPTVKEGFDRH
jgi:hypothetical protein